MSECAERWEGTFGDDYTKRNNDAAVLKAKEKFLRSIWPYEYGVSFFSRMSAAKTSVIEFGANRGLNIKAMMNMGIAPGNITAVEINALACGHINDLDERINCLNENMLEGGYGRHDVVLCMGVLIHTPPSDINAAYDVLANSCNSYIIMGEYFAPTETEVLYRGNTGMLWRRNYGKDFLERHPEFELYKYGFVADIDPVMPLDNINYWLLRRK